MEKMMKIDSGVTESFRNLHQKGKNSAHHSATTKENGRRVKGKREMVEENGRKGKENGQKEKNKRWERREEERKGKEIAENMRKERK